MTATLERPQTSNSSPRVRRGAAYWLVALLAVLGLVVGLAVGYWWGESDGDTADTTTRSAVELTSQQERAVATVDAVTVALNSGDSDLIDSLYSDEATYSEGTWTDRAVSRDDYFEVLYSLEAEGYEYVSKGTAVLGEPFGVMVDVSQFLTATHPDQPPVTLVAWFRVDPETMTILEASVSGY
jgi:hypothetical protein